MLMSDPFSNHVCAATTADDQTTYMIEHQPVIKVSHNTGRKQRRFAVAIEINLISVVQYVKRLVSYDL